MECTGRRPVVPGPPDLSVVVVSFNVAPLLAACLESVAPRLPRGGELVVVDNASADGSAALVRERFPSVTLLANDRNLGFGAACNQGAARARGRYVLFLNPDAALTPGALPTLVARARRTPRAAVVGPRVVFPDGRPQPTRRRFPTLGDLLVESTPLEWRAPAGSTLGRFRMRDAREEPGRVDWLSGACLLVEKAAFDEVGGFSPELFMYFEEVDLARRLAARGREVWYEPAAVAVHHAGKSAGQDPAARDAYYYGSKSVYVSRYWGPAVARALAGAGGLLFGAEWAVQALRRDGALARRYATLARMHLRWLLSSARCAQRALP